jgi:hypothetical protein
MQISGCVRSLRVIDSQSPSANVFIAFDPNLQLKLIPRTVQRALINLAIEDAIAGEESSCKKCFP